MDLFEDDRASGSDVKLDIRTKPEESLHHLSINQEFADRYVHNKQRAELHQLEAKYGKGAALDEIDDEDDETDSEEDVTEDEDGDQVTADVDAAIFRTLQRIRSKDPSLYDSKLDIFDQENKAAQDAARSLGARLDPSSSNSNKKSSSKKLTLQDYQRQRVQELMKTSQDPARDLAEATTVSSDRRNLRFDDQDHPQNLLPPAQEQEELRKQVSKAFHDGIDDSDDLFTVKSDAEAGRSASSYRDAVLASLGPDADEETIRKALKSFVDGDDPSKKLVLDTEQEQKANEDFLLNYILNRGWIDKKQENAPSKPKLSKSLLTKTNLDAKDEAAEDAETASTSANPYGRDWEAEAAELESEASFDSMADAFETAYNFRFEQGDAAHVIPTYSRTPKDTARRQDNTRKRKREERSERKEEEKRQKMQELSRLKNLKRLEIVEKLKRLREVTGSNAEDLKDIDLENDFDPDQHDRAMANAFGDNFYSKADPDEELEKPTWNDDIEIDDILAEAETLQSKHHTNKKAKKSAIHANDDDDDHDGRIEMDADFLDDEERTNAAAGGTMSSREAAIRARLADKKLSKKDRKKLKKKLKDAMEKAGKAGAASGPGDDDADGVDADDMDAENRPIDDSKVPQEDRKQKAREIIDEYYNLDYEDVIGDQPTRFKYTQVAPADFGMSAVDILLADDTQLNNVVGLKNLQPYRRGKSRPMDLGKRLGEFRREVYGQKKNAASRHNAADGQDGGNSAKKRLGKKERMRLKNAADSTASTTKSTSE